MSQHDDPDRGQDGRAQPPADGDDPQGRQDPPKPSPLKNPKVRWTLILIGVVVLIALIVWLVYHLLIGRYLQETNDAYLRADAVAVAPRVNGYVTKLLVEDHAWVKAGQPLIEIDGRTYTAQLEQAQAAVAGRGRAFLRPSGTEPVVRVTVEADDDALMQATLDTLAGAVRAAA